MSSQSGSDYNTNPKNTKPKKEKAQPINEKRTRRQTRKNNKKQQNENPLPENIPITEGEELIIYRSFELEVTKDIIQVPITLFNQMNKQTWTRVGETILQIKFINNQMEELIIEARLKPQQHNGKKNGTKNSKKAEIDHKTLAKDKKQCQNSNSGLDDEEESEQEDEIIFLVWGKVCWIGNYEVNCKTIKQSPKILNSQSYFQIVKVKTKQVNSDIFIVLNIKKKVEQVSDYNGLINQGNTCYMNSYLQMLSHISQFKNLVFEATIQDQNKFPATLQVLFHKLDNQQKPVSAEQLVKSFGWTKKQVNIQQDAQQFSCIFYEALEMKLQEACQNPKHISMKEMFEGKLLHVIECLKVSNVLISENVEPFFNIPLNISNSLGQSLDDYVAEQVLSGDNLYNTDEYGPQEAVKSVKFLFLPPIIMVQLKRFQFNYHTERNEKIMNKFEYPNTIDFSKWQVSAEGPNQYQLYAVLVHEGVKAESGHYYAFVKIKDYWYRFNDQQVSVASKHQVFDYNFGGEIDLVEFDAREFKVFNRKTVSSSTAYMLVYVKTELKEKLLNGEPVYPEWLKQHEIVKQEQREQQRNRKNFYHNVQALNWSTNIKGSIADFLGLIPKNVQQLEGQQIGRLIKSQKIEDWIKPFNQKGLGVYIYLTSMQKVEYETLINLQYRKSNFQEVIRDPNCPINLIYFPLIISPDSFLFIIKLGSVAIKTIDQGEQNYQYQIKFHQILQVDRNFRNSHLLNKLKSMYEEQNFQLRYFYEEKKQLTQIKNDNLLVRGPAVQRNVLGIIIVQKIHKQLEEKFPYPTNSWYHDLKNYVEICVKSEDGKYEFQIQMDQNKSIQNLREHIFQSKIKDDGVCVSSENIVLKGKPKKTAKNFTQIIGAKTVRDLIKNCDKQNIIVFSISNLKADQRISQVQIKFVYRFKDFSFSDVFHVAMNRNLDNKSYNIYQKILEHEEVNKFRKSQKLDGIRVFLFGRDKNIINDIVSESGHVHGKGEIAQVLQKQKGSHLVVEGFEIERIQEDVFPVLLHHRSQTDEKIGNPKYLEFNRSTKLTQLYQLILEQIKDDTYEWEDKKIKINPMKLTLYAYSKDYSKGVYLADEETLIQMQIEQKKEKLREKQKQKEKCEIHEQQKQKQVIRIEEQQPAEIKEKQKKLVEIVIDESDEQQKSKFNTQTNNKDNLRNIHHEVVSTGKGNNQKKNEKNLKPWQKTIENIFGKAKFIKVVVHHLYLTRAQTTMKINV